MSRSNLSRERLIFTTEELRQHRGSRRHRPPTQRGSENLLYCVCKSENLYVITTHIGTVHWIGALSAVRLYDAHSFEGGVMKAKRNKGEYVWLLYAALNLALLAGAVAFGLVSFFASLEIVLSLGARVIWESMGDTVQGKYALATLRNVWLLVGGIVFLVVIIYCINVFFKRWREMRIQRAYIILLAAEALIVFAAQALT